MKMVFLQLLNRRCVITVLTIVFSVVIYSTEASQRDRVQNFKSKLQMRIREKQLLEGIKRQLNQPNAQMLAPASKGLRSQNGIPKHVTPLANQISRSEETSVVSSSIPVVEAAPVLRSSFQTFKSRSKSNMITALSAKRNLLVFDLNEVVGGNPPVQSLKLFVHVLVSHKQPKARSLSTSGTAGTKSRSNSTTSAPRDVRRKGKRRRWRKQSKIRVFLSNSKGKRKRRIAELRKEINETGNLQLVLPVSLISSLSKNATDNKLYLRLQCKRCSRNTQFLLRGLDTPERCADRKRKQLARRQNSKQRQLKRQRKRPRKLRRKIRLWKNCEDGTKTRMPTFIYRYARPSTKHNARRHRRHLFSSLHSAT
ncbi:hypothetical protein EGW08_006900 [Elysia chlorotica]|uniref:Uncharacterized protein n=1 Tax=Elysia chlorotica TaxID=188477 RepID=A0A3S1BJM8_ELYCH|nr:hypothetical protein EGW08_006900 [Elysia chlorotica]